MLILISSQYIPLYTGWFLKRMVIKFKKNRNLHFKIQNKNIRKSENMQIFMRLLFDLINKSLPFTFQKSFRQILPVTTFYVDQMKGSIYNHFICIFLPAFHQINVQCWLLRLKSMWTYRCKPVISCTPKENCMISAFNCSSNSKM